jgi:hypothetical protein
MKLTEISDAQLLEGLRSLVGQGRAVLARLLAYLGEVLDAVMARHPRDALTALSVQTILLEALALLT